MKINIAIFFFLFCNAVNAQHTFIKTTSDTGFGVYIKVLPMNDNGWVVCSLDSMKITKFNNCGDIEWNHQYQIPNAMFGFYNIVKTNDDGIAFLTSNKTGNLFLTQLTKLDAQGTILWSKTYSIGTYTHTPFSISEDHSGNLFITSYVTGNNAGIYNSHTLVFKTDNNGTLIWSHFYNQGIPVWGPSTATSDDGILICGWGLFIKLDNNGIVQWDYYDPNDTSYTYISSAIELSDGYIYAYTNHQNPGVIFNKIDKQGNQLWPGGKMLNYTNIEYYLNKKSNGNFASLFNQPFSNTVVAVEFDKDLNVVVENAFSGNGSNLIGMDICFLSDNNPVIAGAINSSEAIFVAKTDLDFKLDCNTGFDPVTSTQIPVITKAHSTTFISVNLQTVNQNVSFTSFTNSAALICSNPKILDLGNDTAVCPEALVTLKNLRTDVFDHYNWSTGDTTNSIVVNHPGTYWLKAYDDCELYIYNDTIIISDRVPFAADLGGNKILCDNESITLKVNPCDSCNFNWNTGSKSDSIEINLPGIYSLTVQNKFGCISGDTIQVDTAKCECDFYLPNAFTPNDDGLNELFIPKYYCDYTAYKLSIYNRWGQKVFESDDIEKGWNGKSENKFVPQGSYIYSLSYTPIIRNKIKVQINKIGTVAVIY